MITTTQLGDKAAQQVLDRIIDTNDMILKIEKYLLVCEPSYPMKDVSEKVVLRLKEQLLTDLNYKKI